MCNLTLIATPMKANKWVQIRYKERPNVAKGKTVLQSIVKNLKIDHGEKSFVFHIVKETEKAELVLNMTLG